MRAVTDVLKIIDDALKRKGLSDAAASNLAVGNPSLIKNMRNGRGRFSWDALESLGRVLDLHLYYGPGNTEGPVQITVEANETFGPNREEVQSAISRALDAVYGVSAAPSERSDFDAARLARVTETVEELGALRRLARELKEEAREKGESIDLASLLDQMKELYRSNQSKS